MLSHYRALHSAGIVHHDVEYRHWLRSPSTSTSTAPAQTTTSRLDADSDSLIKNHKIPTPTPKQEMTQIRLIDFDRAITREQLVGRIRADASDWWDRLVEQEMERVTSMLWM